jgi:hypothetical protein
MVELSKVDNFYSLRLVNISETLAVSKGGTGQTIHSILFCIR